MKSVKLAVFMLVAMVFSVSASATGLVKNTLTVERFCTSNVGQAIASTQATYRLKDEATCLVAQAAKNNKETSFNIAGRPISCNVVADCVAVDYHVQY